MGRMNIYDLRTKTVYVRMGESEHVDDMDAILKTVDEIVEMHANDPKRGKQK